MPVFNLTIPDTSPLIVYAGGRWGDSSHDDPKLNGYINSTFHATQDNGATASLTFNGSAVYVFGANRSNHGQYLATLDGASTIGNGFAPTGDFNVSLYSQTDLQTEQHQLVLTNEWAGSTDMFLDVDYMVITSGDGNPSTPSVDVVMDDGHQNITYSAGWDNSTNDFIQFYFNQTMHRTQIPEASASVRFYGNAITVYGATSVNHGFFSISLDGIPIASNLNGSAPAFRAQNMLYYFGGLSTTLHNLTITNTDTTGLSFDLDKVVVSTWPVELVEKSTSTHSVATSASSHHSVTISGTAASSSDTSTTSSGVNMSAIIGGVMSSVVVIALSILAVFFIIRRRRRRARGTNIPPWDSDGHVQPFIIDPPGSSQTNDLHGRAAGQSQASWRASATIPYASGMPTFTSTSVPETENPHRDFPPPDYEEATASNSRR